MFRDRADAGRRLAARLAHLKDEVPVVLALPRGGVPVAYEIAQALGAPLDVILVRKIGAPWQTELALAAVVGSNPPHLAINDEIVAALAIPPDYIETQMADQLAEIERRRRLYVGQRQPIGLAGRVVIVVDDGIATGATVRAALKGVAAAGPRRVILAIPVAPSDTLELLRDEADEVVCLHAPGDFGAVSLFYDDYPQIADKEVIELLRRAPR